MSIGYFSYPYPDELIFSCLSRYLVHSGFPYYNCVLEDFFLPKVHRIDKEFMKQLKPEAVEILSRNKGVEELIEKHTMYPYYGRFLDKDRRTVAYEALCSLDGDFSKLFGVPQLSKGEQRYFRFCPICVMEDREQYGETYYHRMHQMRKVNICPVHGCYLLDSSVSLDSKVNVMLASAEQVISTDAEWLNNNTIFCKNVKEVELAKYMLKVFQQPIDRSNEASISDFFQIQMLGTPYLSPRGGRKFFKRLYEDMQAYYKEVPEMDSICNTHVQGVLRGKRISYNEICMVAMFLGVSAEELAVMKTLEKTPAQQFDETAWRMVESGLTVVEIAKKLGVDPKTVQMVVEPSEKTKRKQPRAGNVTRQFDWEALDKKNIALVKRTIEELHGNGVERPVEITMYSVGKRANISSYWLKRMERCRREIEKNCESHEKYMARKVIWCVRLLKRNDEAISCWKIVAIASISREQITACLPHLEQIAEPELVEQVKAVL